VIVSALLLLRFLSGAPPGRGWRQPVPVIDVLRGAIGEIEDYARVEMVSDAHDFVAGGAVADLTHLLAELIENAAAYSPPHTRVRVSAGRVAAGLVVEIEDRGLGIPPATLTALNDRLANPPEFNLADTDQLGLFVVSRLAARHQIKVSLRGSPYGGTTAIVLMPQRIVVREDDPASPPGAGLARATSPEMAVTAGAAPAGAAMHNSLPRRFRQASLAPQLRDGPPADGAPSAGVNDERSADQARALIASIQQGWRNGRAKADETGRGFQNTPPNTNPDSHDGRAES
jgi:hypothetical protein